MAKKAPETDLAELNTDDNLFVFDLDTAIRDQVVAKLEKSKMFPLQKGLGPRESGIYVLYFKEKLVYVGKASKETTKSGRTLRMRINEHVSKINSRQNITLDDMGCKFLTFESEWYVFAAEYVLIAYFTPEWNASGFGSKVPGRGRPGTERISLWDDQFPVKRGLKPAKKVQTKEQQEEI